MCPWLGPVVQPRFPTARRAANLGVGGGGGGGVGDMGRRAQEQEQEQEQELAPRREAFGWLAGWARPPPFRVNGGGTTAQWRWW